MSYLLLRSSEQSAFQRDGKVYGKRLYGLSTETMGYVHRSVSLLLFRFLLSKLPDIVRPALLGTPHH